MIRRCTLIIIRLIAHRLGKYENPVLPPMFHDLGKPTGKITLSRLEISNRIFPRGHTAHSLKLTRVRRSASYCVSC